MEHGTTALEARVRGWGGGEDPERWPRKLAVSLIPGAPPDQGKRRRSSGPEDQTAGKAAGKWAKSTSKAFRLAEKAVNEKGERTVSELAAEYGVHPTMIHQWKKALLEGASDILERAGKKKAEVDEETVRSLRVKIGELAVADEFLSRKLKPWTVK